MDSLIYETKKLIEKADAILITAGSGMSIDSGIPYFKNNESFWNKYPIFRKYKLNDTQVRNPKWFRVNPELAWAFWGQLYNLSKNKSPHKGYELLLEIIKEKNNNGFVYTSTIDEHFKRAGFDENKIVNFNGSIFDFQCQSNCNNKIWSDKTQNFEINVQNFEAIKIPLCNDCLEVSRPNILMFQDSNWNHIKTAKQIDRFNLWYKKVKDNNEKLVIIELGSTLDIPAIKQLGKKIATEYKNAELIRINPLGPIIDKSVGIVFEFDISQVLTSLLNKEK